MDDFPSVNPSLLVSYMCLWLQQRELHNKKADWSLEKLLSLLFMCNHIKDYEDVDIVLKLEDGRQTGLK